MRFLSFSMAVLASAAAVVLAEEETLKSEVTYAVECERKTQKGDKVHMHYTGSLASNGNVFDSSVKRGKPFSFTVGSGQVIKGWDQGLLDMCIGEKRLLTIPPSLGYGQRNMGAIPAGSTLIFETELIGIEGVETPKDIVGSSVSSAAASATSAVADKAAEAEGSVADTIAEKVGDAAEAIKVVLQDTDGDGQEHNEL